MKVRVQIQNKASVQATSTLEVVVGEGETVACFKERVASLQQLPFLDQLDLAKDGKVLLDSQEVASCGVKELGPLELHVKATSADFAKQLAGLLQTRGLSCDELSMLYCYKHGVSVSHALKSVGVEEKLQEFLKKEKSFQVDNGCVSLFREGSAASQKPATPASVAVKPARDVQPPRQVQQRERITASQAAYERRAEPVPVPVAAPRVVEKVEAAEAGPQSLWLASSAKAEEEEADIQQYMDLHTKICSRPFNSRATQLLSEVVDAVLEKTCLNVVEVVKGGSIGKGTAIEGASDGEVVLLLAGLPASGLEKCLPSLLKAAAGTLTETLCSEKDQSIDEIRVVADSIQVVAKGLVTVEIRLSPHFKTRAQAMEALSESGPENARRFCGVALAKDSVQFVSRQPNPVKMTIRLLKWWRDQQDWTAKLTRPSDQILELMAIYSAVQTRPENQKVAVANAMSLMSRFDELRIVWSNNYSRQDVWAPLLRQRPLVMDPVNPYVNIADPQVFDARELMMKARTTRFFW